jgi:hypothetical protein
VDHAGGVARSLHQELALGLIQQFEIAGDGDLALQLS